MKYIKVIYFNNFNNVIVTLGGETLICMLSSKNTICVNSSPLWCCGLHQNSAILQYCFQKLALKKRFAFVNSQNAQNVLDVLSVGDELAVISKFCVRGGCGAEEGHLYSLQGVGMSDSA